MAEPTGTGSLGETLQTPHQALSRSTPQRKRKPSASDERIAGFLADLSDGRVVPTEPNADPEPDACPLCKGAGFFAYDIADRNHPDFGKVYPCECRQPALRAKRLEELFGKADIYELWENRSFASYEALPNGDQAACRKVREWAESGTGSLFLYSGYGSDRPEGFGVGKTGLAIAALRHRVEATECDALFKKAPDLLAAIRASFDREAGGPTESAVIDAIRDVTLLVIDDIGAEAITDWRRDQFFRIIDHRHDRLLPTIFTSNFTEDDLAREKRLGPRIAWRLHEMAWPNFVEMNGSNLRAT